jgi:hypothetical protein
MSPALRIARRGPGPGTEVTANEEPPRELSVNIGMRKYGPPSDGVKSLGGPGVAIKPAAREHFIDPSCRCLGEAFGTLEIQ